MIEDTRELPQQLSEYGKIILSRVDISKLMGKLFLHKAQVNLHSDILDIPDFFWEYSDLGKQPFFFKKLTIVIPFSRYNRKNLSHHRYLFG